MAESKKKATVNKTAKVNLYADMRKAIVAAHNEGNKKAIDAQRVADLGINATSFNTWTARVKLLRDATFDYVAKKRGYKYDKGITAEQVTEAREKIYPMWKELLSYGERSKYAKELKCSEADVEDLVGFVWKFYNTGAGTAEICVKETDFRKKVESLLGCAIAKNDILSEDDRETLSKYSKLISGCRKADKKIEEHTEKRKGLEFARKGAPKTEEKFIEYLDGKIAEIDKEIKEIEAEKAKKEEKIDAMIDAVKAIQSKMNLAK